MEKIHSQILVVALAIIATGPLSAQEATGESLQIKYSASVASPEKYQTWMTQGRSLKAKLAEVYRVPTALDARNAFQEAVNVAPDSALRAEAMIEGGEVLSAMAEMSAAIATFQAALKEEITPDMKSRALLGIAHSEYHVAFMSETLKQNAEKLRANFDAVITLGKLSALENQKMRESLAEIYQAEGRHVEAASEYSHLMDVSETAHQQETYADNAIEQLKKARKISALQQTKAVELTDKTFSILLPMRQKHGGSYVSRSQIDYANLLGQFGQTVRAEALWSQLANDSTIQQKSRADFIVQMARSQMAQQKYDVALQTLERLPKLTGQFKRRYHFERAKVFTAQDKLSLASGEYSKLLLQNVTPNEKVEAYWGMADIAEKEAAALRQKKASPASISAKFALQKHHLLTAQLQKASPQLLRETWLKLARWETAHGADAEAKKWQNKAAQAAKTN